MESAILVGITATSVIAMLGFWWTSEQYRRQVEKLKHEWTEDRGELAVANAQHEAARELLEEGEVIRNGQLSTIERLRNDLAVHVAAVQSTAKERDDLRATLAVREEQYNRLVADVDMLTRYRLRELEGVNNMAVSEATVLRGRVGELVATMADMEKIKANDRNKIASVIGGIAEAMSRVGSEIAWLRSHFRIEKPFKPTGEAGS